MQELDDCTLESVAAGKGASSNQVVKSGVRQHWFGVGLGVGLGRAMGGGGVGVGIRASLGSGRSTTPASSPSMKSSNSFDPCPGGICR